MKKAMVIAAMVVLVSLTGCKKKPRPVASVPPGPDAADANVEVVYVGSSTSPGGGVSTVPDPVVVPAPSGSTGGAYMPPAPPAAAPGATYSPSPAAPTYSPPPSAAPFAALGANPGTHTVARGDTLWSIAKRYYGDGRRYGDIMRANGITNPRKLRIGQQLRLP